MLPPNRTAMLATCIVAFSAFARPTAAQRASASSAALMRIDSLLEAGHTPDARTTLERWNADHPIRDSTVTSNERAHALTLSARLATTWADAQQAWLAVALGYPISSFAPESMLRLGQGLLADRATPGTLSRAASYLERLINDYPNSPLRATGFLWLARAHNTAGRRDAACARLDQARTIRTDSVTATLIESDFRRLCTAPTRAR
jgi:TolA-binding protein